MKHILYFTTAVLLFTSCGSNQKTTDKNQAIIDSMSQAMTRQHIIDSMNAVTAAPVAPVTPVPAPAPATNYSRPRHGSYSYEHHHSYSGHMPVNNGAAPSTTVTNAPVAPSAADVAAQRKADRKKEWKSAAEGALIGAGAGALGGAAVGKNNKFKGQDAAVGGVLGAAAGAGAGLLIEKHKLKKQEANDNNNK